MSGRRGTNAIAKTHQLAALALSEFDGPKSSDMQGTLAGILTEIEVGWKTPW